MKTSMRIAERFSLMVMGTALTVMGLILIVLGVTVFPLIGILMAFPVLGLAFGCFRPGSWAVAAESETEPESGVPESLAA